MHVIGITLIDPNLPVDDEDGQTAEYVTFVGNNSFDAKHLKYLNELVQSEYVTGYPTYGEIVAHITSYMQIIGYQVAESHIEEQITLED
jgi:hypothetical protein